MEANNNNNNIFKSLLEILVLILKLIYLEVYLFLTNLVYLFLKKLLYITNKLI